MRQRISDRNLWLPPLVLIAIGAVILFFAPAEKTMGGGIKPVYVHVAFSWAGMVGVLLGGALGVWVLATDSPRWHDWMETIAWVGVIWFLLGVIISFAAAKANWGAILLTEPRTAAGLQFSAIALIAKTLAGWLPWRRLRAAVNVALVGVLWLLTFSAPLILHPRDPIRTATSAGIQITFAAMFVVVLLLGVWACGIMKNEQ